MKNIARILYIVNIDVYVYTPKYTANHTAEGQKLLRYMYKHVSVHAHVGVHLNAASLSTAAAYVELFVVQQPDGLHELLNTRRQREGLRKQLHLVVKLKTAASDDTEQSHNCSCRSGSSLYKTSCN